MSEVPKIHESLRDTPGSILALKSGEGVHKKGFLVNRPGTAIDLSSRNSGLHARIDNGRTLITTSQNGERSRLLLVRAHFLHVEQSIARGELIVTEISKGLQSQCMMVVGQPRNFGGIILPPIESILIGYEELVHHEFRQDLAVIDDPFAEVEELLMPLAEKIQTQHERTKLSPRAGRLMGRTAVQGEYL
ncbi:MAG TPA: hypothetical protein VLA77_00445 [Candidatus Saccharimonadales bacterium]|nr:hypothetical protein [Candidatus Saccharimonadales bacterium]